MSWLKTLSKLIIYQKPPSGPLGFESGVEDRPPEKRGQAGGNEGRNLDASNGDKTGADAAGNGQNHRKNGSRSRMSRRRKTRGTDGRENYPQQVEKNRELDRIWQEQVELSHRLEENREVLEKVFRVPENKDAVFRSFTIGTCPPARAILVFIDGITNAQVQNMAVLQPLMLLSGAGDPVPGRRTDNPDGEPPEQDVIGRDFFNLVKQVLLPNNQMAEARVYGQVVNDILNGNSALFIEGCNRALLLETKGWHFRSVATPQVESVIRGPQEGFTEMLRINTTLVRKIIQRPSLVTEFVKVGEATPMQCAVMYIADIANPGLVREVKRRLESIRSDMIQETGLVEQLIEDQPLHLVPQVLTTERPDRVAAGLVEGKVAVFVDGNPFVMTMPCTFFNLMQSPEDAYVRWPFGNMMRLLRYMGLFLALLLPAHYVAIVAYHQEFIPTDLLMAITGARERVPFPSIVEVLIMEGSFELIREAGIRIPGTIGTTLGIVGALILGQAAVAANIVSPILIIVVAVTALGSFAIPNYSFSLSVRLLRFVYVILASLSGLLGILVGVFIHVGVMTTVKSFGVPFLAPVAPVTRKDSGYIWRLPAWSQEERPDYLDPLKKRSQPEISRRWLRPGGEEDGKT